MVCVHFKYVLYYFIFIRIVGISQFFLHLNLLKLIYIVIIILSRIIKTLDSAVDIFK